MTDNAHNARVTSDAGTTLTSVPLKIRLALGAIFVAGIFAVFLP